MSTEASLVWGLLFGCIGLGYFLYGKQQRKAIPFMCGVGLMLFPYFVSNSIVMVLIGAILMAIPYFVRI
ncbi:MAG: hypothetical protein ABI451_08635 [Dokdonella sp.]